ncbi:MAG: DsbA family protein [Alphaproteobacteria bacterium]|nr:DsbA family protein [Alphaproteobacteria bacterium]
MAIGSYIAGAAIGVASYVYIRKVSMKPGGRRGIVGALIKEVVPAIGIFYSIVFISCAVAYRSIPKYLAKNPEIIEQSQALAAEMAEAREMAAAKDALKNLGASAWQGAPIIGNPQGKIVVFEFYDFNCGHCKRAAATLSTVIADQKDVKVVLKNFPIFPQVSLIPAKASIAAAYQGKGLEMYKALYSTNLIPEIKNPQQVNQKELDEKITAIVMKAAKDAGLDVERLKVDMESEAVIKELIGTRELAEKLKIMGTPAFIIGDQIFKGAVDERTMRIAIENARK